MSSNDQDKPNKGLEGTAIDLPINRRANLKSATSDDDFTNILAHIKSSKTPVSNHTSNAIIDYFNSNNLVPFISHVLTSLHTNVHRLILFLFFPIASYAISYRRYVFDSSVLSQNCLQAVINYGASWCRVCSQILPAFCRLSNNFPKLTFVYADIDECPETTQHIRYTPTFQFYRNGEKVDEMYGAGEERLHDRLWLHS
ncbi:Thioredoxin 3-3 [Spatholobus suberectus]|nr:Thioredoxin 3-3 [Spatholobus suberectus]